jgi:Flp pilus assembly protein TadG
VLTWYRRRLARDHPERGSETLSFVIVFPVLLLVILVTLQTALWFLGRSTALAAAQEGVRAARSGNAPAGAGSTAATAFATEVGQGMLDDVRVDVRSTAVDIEVEVTGSVPSLVPGLQFTVVQLARGAKERFTTPQDARGDR